LALRVLEEELVAEMGPHLCGVCGIENVTIDNSAAYIQSWMQVCATTRTCWCMPQPSAKGRRLYQTCNPRWVLSAYQERGGVMQTATYPVHLRYTHDECSPSSRLLSAGTSTKAVGTINAVPPSRVVPRVDNDATRHDSETIGTLYVTGLTTTASTRLSVMRGLTCLTCSTS